MPSLDIPTFDAPQFMPETGAALTDTTSGKTESLPELNEIKLEDFDFPAADTLPKAGVLDISGTDSQGESSDFNFEINTIAPEASDLKNKDASESNAFDLTTISLDLSDGADTSAAAEESSSQAVEMTLSEHEPIEVETKLDLVAAYIEMDDKEGAKELLDEVMKEGGTNQRKRAEALLAKLA